MPRYTTCFLDLPNIWGKKVLCISLCSLVSPLVRLLPIFLGIRALDFSEIWHEGSLMVPLKSDGARFLKKKIICPGWARKSFKKNRKKNRKKNFPEFFQIFFQFFFKKTNFFPSKKFFFCSKKFNPPKKFFFQSLINKMQ